MSLISASRFRLPDDLGIAEGGVGLEAMSLLETPEKVAPLSKAGGGLCVVACKVLEVGILSGTIEETEPFSRFVSGFGLVVDILSCDIEETGLSDDCTMRT